MKRIDAKGLLSLSLLFAAMMFLAAPVIAQTPECSADAEKYNITPLLKFRDKLVDWHKNNDFNLPFEYSFEGKVDTDGKLIVEKPPVFVGDPRVEQIVSSGITAISDSKIFKLLSDLKVQNIKLLAVQDGKQFNFSIDTFLGTERESLKTYNGLKIALDMAKILKSNDGDNDTSELLKMTTVGRSEKKITIQIDIPNEFAEAMYQKHKNDLGNKQK